MAAGRRATIDTDAMRRAQERRAGLGGQIRAARLRRGWTQAQLAARAKVGRMVIGRVERGVARLDLDLLERIALALELPLTVTLGRDPQQDVADAGHLAIQELVLRLARASGLDRRFEMATTPNEPWRSADVYLGSTRQRAAADIECWNTFGDFGAAARSSTRKVAELGQRAVAAWGAEGRASLCWVVRDTRRNRELVRKYTEVFDRQFPGSSVAWVRALTQGGPIPNEPGLVWCDVRATRIFAWRKR